MLTNATLSRRLVLILQWFLGINFAFRLVAAIMDGDWLIMALAALGLAIAASLPVPRPPK